jgi:transposase
MSATHVLDSTPNSPAKLYLAFDLGWTSWNLAFTTAMAQKPRLRTIPARDLDGLQREIQRAKQRFGLPASAPILSCYEAGRDGFWLHRYLDTQAIHNLVVDAASIEVNRRARRAKSDRLDVAKLLTMLIRYHGGEHKLWSVVRVPSPDDEDRRQPHRELMAVKNERTEHSNRVKGLLANLGIDIYVDEHLPDRIAPLRQWDGSPVPPELTARILREFERWTLADRQARDLENAQRRAFRDDETADVEKLRLLLDLKAIGPMSATLFVREFFGWREIKNRRELASLAGLTPTPYTSGDSQREQGISKAGNRRLRWMAVEIAWGWLRWQPQSALSLWYQRRFGSGNARLRKVGIVALARRLLIALWRYLDQGEVPEGAEFTPWEKKLNGRMPAGASAVGVAEARG